MPGFVVSSVEMIHAAKLQEETETTLPNRMKKTQPCFDEGNAIDGRLPHLLHAEHHTSGSQYHASGGRTTRSMRGWYSNLIRMLDTLSTN